MNSNLIARCKLIVSDPAKLNIANKDAGGGGKQPKDIYQRYIEIEYPGKMKSNSMVIPGCVMHHEVKEYYGTPSIHLAIPKKEIMEPLQLALNKIGYKPVFEERNVHSTDEWWWIRVGLKEALSEGKESIRTVNTDKDGNVVSTEFYSGFAELFDDYPSSLTANITCSLKLKTSVEKDAPLTGNEEWRIGINVVTYNPIDPTEIEAPQTGVVQSSLVSRRDGMSSRMAQLRKRVQ
ncbi:TPA_asm: hypothetical protein GF920_14625 [Listeria monocytogenes]|nr:hypothetical protein [Listeria monocytogenes]HAA5746306.1 hypothetical protein [Listeria monocytogenes]HAA5805822.1 hypothetical protein [Listeria monocytogenes]HAA5832750.1 hypothetical protein [Listeria monocytogenes]HAA5926465.1 hypothetical protein [Listeria monocytogenes]